MVDRTLNLSACERFSVLFCLHVYWFTSELCPVSVLVMLQRRLECVAKVSNISVISQPLSALHLQTVNKHGCTLSSLITEWINDIYCAPSPLPFAKRITVLRFGTQVRG